jgi:hypothetical protein
VNRSGCVPTCAPRGIHESSARAGLPGVTDSLAPCGSLEAGAIRIVAVRTAEAAASCTVTFVPAAAPTTEPGAGVGACQLTAPASPRAAVPEASKTPAQIAADITKPGQWLRPPTTARKYRAWGRGHPCGALSDRYRRSERHQAEQAQNCTVLHPHAAV